MGISDEDIRKVREASDIVSVFSDRIPLRQKGRTFWCCCPFHEERSPSCQIDPATQLFYCFGCHEGGDVFSYIMKSEDIDFPDAVRKLADRAGIEIHETGRNAASRSYKARLKEVCKESCEFYHLQLMRGKSSEADAARAYLSGRGLGGSVPRSWQLGFAPGRKALYSHLSSKGYSVKEMVDANVVTRYEGKPPQDRFFNRIMFPIFDDQGDCIAFGGRVVGKGEPKYLNSQETPLFHKSSVLYGLDRAKSAMTSTGVALVVEGYTDVIALHEAGMTNAVATLGTALTRQHIRILSRHAGKKIVYLFDGDEAGQRAADRALGFIDQTMNPEPGRKRIDLCACTLPDNLDPADFVGKYGIDALRAQLDAAPSLISYGIERRLAAYDLNSAESRALAFRDALQVLAPIKDSLVAQDYAVQIASRLHVREDEALARLAALQPPEPDPDDSEGRFGAQPAAYAQAGGADQWGAQAQEPVQVQLSDAERSRRRFEMEFIGLCGRYPQIAMIQADALACTQWHVPLFAQIAERMLDILAERPDADSTELIGLLNTEFPQSARAFVESHVGSKDPATYAAFLVEELALGDLSDQIDSYREMLHHPEGMDPEFYDNLFKSVTAMQKQLAERSALHARTPL